MAIAIPLPCKLNVLQPEDVSVNSDTFIPSETQYFGKKNFNLTRRISISWENLSHEDALTVDNALLSTRGVVKLIWNNKKYAIDKGYQIEINNSLATIKLNLLESEGRLAAINSYDPLIN